MNMRQKYATEYDIQVIEAYDLLNTLFGNGLLPSLSVQETAIAEWCKGNNAYWYKFIPKNEFIRWTIMQAAEQGYKTIVWDMQP